MCALAFAGALALAGCLSGKKVSDVGSAPTAAPHVSGVLWSLPPGVVVPDAVRGALDVEGLYPSTIANDRMCCWLATRARVLSRKTAPAKRLEVTVYVPDYPFFHAHPQGLAVSIDGAPVQRRCCYGPGVYTLTFDLPARMRGKRGDVPLAFATTGDFVPVREHVNADTRHLGVVLMRVGYS